MTETDRQEFVKLLECSKEPSHVSPGWRRPQLYSHSIVWKAFDYARARGGAGSKVCRTVEHASAMVYRKQISISVTSILDRMPTL